MLRGWSPRTRAASRAEWPEPRRTSTSRSRSLSETARLARTVASAEPPGRALDICRRKLSPDGDEPELTSTRASQQATAESSSLGSGRPSVAKAVVASGQRRPAASNARSISAGMASASTTRTSGSAVLTRLSSSFVVVPHQFQEISSCGPRLCRKQSASKEVPQSSAHLNFTV